MPKQTIADIVTANHSELTQMTYPQLVEWGKERWNSQAGFSTYKRALKASGINIDLMAINHRQDKADALAAKATHHITLIVDGYAKYSRFAVCDGQGVPLWYGKNFDGHDHQADAERDAAEKAVWLAGKIREAKGADAITLTLKTDAQFLTYSHDPKNPGSLLKAKAAKLGVALSLEWIPSDQNPADPYTRAQGFKKWQENDLTTVC